MFGKRNELPIPLIAKNDRNAVEIARIWVANGGQHISFCIPPWDDPAGWGILLVDFMKMVSNSYESENSAMSKESVLQRIKEGFDAEWEKSTDNPQLNKE
jgi:hypothetical protein